MKVLVLADDMTGALEIGAIFAAAGADSIVVTQPSTGSAHDVLVLDTESRHDAPDMAAGRVAQFVREARVRPDLVYKKTDSTLRGNIRTELGVLSTLFPEWKIAYVPAYPRQGRTARNGVVYVDGTPLTRTEFARDALNPVLTSSVHEVLGEDLPCEIFDGETDDDVAQAAKTILADSTMRIVAGPAAIAGALAELLFGATCSRNAVCGLSACLVLNGSRNERSASQARYALQQGCMSESADSGWMYANVEPPEGIQARELAEVRAKSIVNLLKQRRTSSVFVIGGDTAFAIVSELGSPPLIPVGEVVPGVAVSRIEKVSLPEHLATHGCDLMLITKAGGFGPVDVICRVRQILEQNAG